MTSLNVPRNSSDSEADLLACEANAAQAAVLATLQDLRSGLATAADPRIWAQEHPWVSVGAAAAAGFAAAALVVPSSEQKLTDKLSRLLDGMQPAHPQPDAALGVAAAPHAASRPLAMIMESLVDVAKTAITNFVVAAVHKSSEPSAPGQAPERGVSDTNTNSEPVLSGLEL